MTAPELHDLRRLLHRLAAGGSLAEGGVLTELLACTCVDGIIERRLTEIAKRPATKRARRAR